MPETIVCVGTVTLDTIALIPSFPGPDDRIEADELVTAGGGNAATAAVAIARLGVPVEFSGVVGTDEAGDTVIAGLEAAGVGTSLVQRRSDVSTAQSVVLVSRTTGVRSIVTRPAAAPREIPAGFDWVHLDKVGYRALHGGGGDRSAKYSLDDGNLTPDLDLRFIDLYIPTAEVLCRRFNTDDAVAAAEKARAAGSSAVVATAGSAGSFAVDERGLAFAPAYNVTELVSTLGAGDVFHGALLAAVATGQPLVEAIRFANVTAALSCRGLDGRSTIPDRAEVQTALRTLPAAELGRDDIVARFAKQP